MGSVGGSQNHSTVTDLEGLTNSIPFLTFTFHCKIDKEGNVIIDNEYGDINIVSIGKG